MCASAEGEAEILRVVLSPAEEVHEFPQTGHYLRHQPQRVRVL